jgi:hypothetical protein
MCILGISCAAIAQTNHGSWANVSNLVAGQKIQVVEVTKKKHSGAFVSASDSGIVFNGAAGHESVQRENVRSVKLIENRHRLRNTLIGLGLGAGAGAATGLGVGEANKSKSNGFNIVSTGSLTLAGSLGGGLVGAIVGVLLPSHDTIYSVSPH